MVENNGISTEDGRENVIEEQTKLLLDVAHESGILVHSSSPIADPSSVEQTICGTEHIVEFDHKEHRVHKLTRPPYFGLSGGIVKRRTAPNLRTGTPEIYSEHFDIIDAGPLDYLERWQMNNDVFQDDVKLERVIAWPDGAASIAISQAQYHGRPATIDEIIRYFKEASWTHVQHEKEHCLFYNYAFETLAIDAAPRNCYITNNELQPFDVILQTPSDSLSDYLKLY